MPRLAVNQKSGSPDRHRDCRSYPDSHRDVRICKPNSVCPHPGPYPGRRGGHHLSGTAVADRLKRPTCTDDSAGNLVPDSGRDRCCLALHLVGFAWPLRSPGTPVRSYRTLSPLAPTAPTVVGTGFSGRDCSLLHVPSSRLLSGRLPVRKHGALWCSDFSHRRPDRLQSRRDGAMTRSARYLLVPCRGRKGPVWAPWACAGDHAKKRSGLDRRLRSYRSSFCFISSTVSL